MQSGSHFVHSGPPSINPTSLSSRIILSLLVDPQDTNIVNGDMFMDMVDESEERATSALLGIKSVIVSF